MDNFWLKLNRPILALAPMAGITDSAFRQICKQYGADVTYSEMASVSALFFKPEKTLNLIKFRALEKPYIVQLFGKEVTHFAQATQIVSQQVHPNGIDINFGCPAKKVFRHGSGCALMPEKKLSRKIIKTVCENTRLPVSIKIRAGIGNTSALDFIKSVADLPFTAVMVHGRTYQEGFSGPVNFRLIEKIKKIIPSKIVLGNGSIQNAIEAKKILTDYPLLDGIGIARGAWGQPWIFNEIKSLLKGKPISPKKWSVRKKIMLEQAELMYQNKGQLGIFEIRKHMSWYVKDFPGASNLRRKLMLAKSLEEIRNILQ